MNRLEMAKRLWGWTPHSEGQAAWIECDAKVKVAACGRRWGKSESTAIDICLYAFEHPNHRQIVVAPSRDQTTIIMDEVERRLYAVPGLARRFDYRKSPYQEIAFKDSLALRPPTEIMARTASITGKGLRGRKAHRVVVDEAAFVAEEVMQKVITPLLADYDGQLIKVSTPDGLNHFWEDFDRGQRPDEHPDYRSFRFPTSSNPMIKPEFLEREKAARPERAFNQEYLAEFLADGSGVFRRVRQSMTAQWYDAAIPGHQYAFGVDWGRSNDYTVIAIVDLTAGAIVHIDRFTEIGYSIQRGRLLALYQKFHPTVIVAEENSMGKPNVEALFEEGLPIFPFYTSNATKSVIVDALALALETGSLTLPAEDKNAPNDRLITLTQMPVELLNFAQHRTPTGMMTYGAPEGKHDDIVIALCLAAWAAQQLRSGSGWFVS